MNKPKLIKRGEIQSSAKPAPKAVTIQKTVSSVKDWLNTRQKNTTQNAREAFAHLFTQPPCTEC